MEARTKEVVPFSMEEAKVGREAAHRKYAQYCTRLYDSDLTLLCTIAGRTLQVMRAEGKNLGEVLPQALNDVGLMARTEEGRVRRQLFLQAVSVMFTERRKAKQQAAVKHASAPKAEAPAAKPKELPTRKGGEQLDLFH